MIKLNAVTKKLKNRKVLDEISVTFEEGKLYLLRGTTVPEKPCF